jgi:signal transduction histidine kinase
MQVFSGGTNVALNQPVSARESHEGFLWAKTNLVDGCNSQHRLADLSPWLRKLASRREVESSLQRVEAERALLAGQILGRSARYAGTGGILFAVFVASLAYRNRLLRALELERLRSRIAADLHDELGARLTGITLAAEAVERKMPDSDSKKPEVMQLSTMAREVVRSIDEIVWAVNPRNDTLEDLADYLFHFTEEFFQHSGIRCRLDLPADLPNIKLETGVRHNLFLCVKEALHNLLKHSKASEARVRLQLQDGRLSIDVEDDGHGFDPGQARAHGNGLKNLRSRMEAIGGTVEIQSRSGKGTCVSFDLRLTRPR